MNKTRISLFYLATYLLLGGIGLLFVPRTAAELLFSNAQYAEVMLRALGMLLIGIGMIVVQIIRLRLDVLYSTTLAIRAFFLICLLVFYFMSRDPFFLVLLGIVALGFILTGTSYLSDTKEKGA